MHVESRFRAGIVAALTLGIIAALTPTIAAAAQPPAEPVPESDSDYAKKLQTQLDAVDAAIRRGPFHADWSSLAAYRTPDWFRDAKFGIFLHWGVYSVPAFANEWYSRNMYVKGSPA